MSECIWEVEPEHGGGLGFVIRADNSTDMIEELKRIGFKSVLTEEAQKTHVIDVMAAEDRDGVIYTASEYHPAQRAICDVESIPEIEEWPSQPNSEEQK